MCSLLVSCARFPDVPVLSGAETASPALLTDTVDLPTLTVSPSATALPSTNTAIPPTPTPSPIPSETPTPTATLPPPEGFNTKLLRPGTLPQEYIPDACEYLRLRWSPEGSPPGTVVVPIMFHGIFRRENNVTAAQDISQKQFEDFITYARYLGYETISTDQLLGFLEGNSRIPPRSMIMIFDDRRLGTIREHVLPVLNEFDWHATVAYITGPVVPEKEWEDLVELVKTGKVDVQAHGYLHNGETYITDFTPVDVIKQEIYGAYSVIGERFGTPPISFIWPGGNFNELAVKMAREAGYRLGFTIKSHGPVMFNWIPQGEEERMLGDPLMLLPRTWSYEANFKLDQATQFAEQARQFAIQNYPSEAAWYRSTCGGELPKLGEIIPDIPVP